MDPYLAPSLAVLRAEINTRWPGRDKASDGWIGDAAHQASKSDHNPNARGSVDAADFDEDGIDFGVVFAAIKRHPSARYVIYERRLYHRLRGWKPEPYDGANPHDKHFHLSIDQTREAEQDRRPWGLLEDDMELTGRQATQLADTHDYLMRLRVGMETMSDGKRSIEQTKWRKRDEAHQRRVDGLLTALVASVEGLDMDAVLRRLDEHAAAEAARDEAAAQRDAELAELVRQANSGELAAQEFVRRVGELFTAAGATPPQAG